MPNNTCALVVGIDHYDFDDHWTLDGPVRDAVRFVDWLLERGVPKEQIVLLLSPSDRNDYRDLSLADGRRPSHAPATLKNIQDSLATQDVPNSATPNLLKIRRNIQAAGTLFVFWCGHGCIDEKWKRRLFCTDADAATARNVEADEVLNSLQSLAWAFRSQLVLVDACAGTANFPAKLPAGELAYSKNFPIHTVSQEVLYSVSIGGHAEWQATRKTGAFSDVLLRTLAGDTGGQWPPGSDALIASAKDHFENREPDEAAGRQRPVLLSTRQEGHWRDLRYAPPRADALMEMLTGLIGPRLQNTGSAAASELAGLLGMDGGGAGLTLPHILHHVIETGRQERLIQWLHTSGMRQSDMTLAEEEVETLASAADVRRRLGAVRTPRRTQVDFYLRASRQNEVPPGGLDGLLRGLANLGPHEAGGLTPMQDFILRIALAEQREDLEVWIHDEGADPEAVQKLREAIQDEACFGGNRLLVDVPPPNGSSQTLEVWIWNEREGLQPQPELSIPCDGRSEDSVRTALLRLFDEILDRSDCQWIVELFLSYPQMGWAVDQWPRPLMLDQSRVGEGQPILLRWRDRAQNGSLTNHKDWRRIARSIREQARPSDREAVYWASEDACQRKVAMGEYEKHGAGSCLGFGFVPYTGGDRLCDRFGATLQRGMPYGLWLRRRPEDWDALRRALSDALVEKQLDQIPIALQDYREGNGDADHPGRHLSLLWDNPRINPFSTQCTTPRQRASA